MYYEYKITFGGITEGQEFNFRSKYKYKNFEFLVPKSKNK